MMNSIFWIISTINVIVFISVYLIILNKLGYKVKNKNIYLLGSSSVIVLILIKKFYVYLSLRYLITYIILLTLLCKVLYGFTWRKALSYATKYSTLYMIMDAIMHYLWLFLNIYLMEKYKWEIIGNFDVMEFFIIKSFILLFVCKFNRIRIIYENYKYYMYILFTIVINILIILFLDKSTNIIYDFYSLLSENKIVYENNFSTMPFINFADFALPYIILILNMIFISLLINAIKSTKEEAKNKVINEKLDMQYNYYLSVKESQERVKTLYHDINNHITNINALQNNNEEVNKYINSINEEINRFENINDSGNILLNTILYEKNEQCKKYNINFTYDINFSKCDFMEMIDVTSIFSNLLDNGIEACNKIDDKEKRYINIRGTIVKKYFVVKCENSKINNINIKNNKLLTDKKDKYLHGIGIQSIKSSIKKYNGDLEINIEDDKFIAMIYIPI
ncbi:GHKL domain-containing protein [Clostridium sp.]|uniref:GHKL domain-containing protein n=1 Tax=Clostridium sp. TaxID=1506 RepID=UPI003F671748